MYFILLTIIIVLLLYIFLASPSLKKIDFSPFESVDIAHRGLHNNKGDAPENSMLAFQKAIDNSYGIEFDIRLSKDKQIVIFHDDNLKRMTGIDDLVENLNYEDLKDIKLLDTNQTIPLFSVLLKLVDGRVPLIVELKCSSKDYKQLAIRTNNILKSYDGIYCVESFNPHAMSWFKYNNRDVIRGQLSTGKFNNLNNKFLSFMLSNLLFNFVSRPNFIAYDHNYRSNLFLKLQKYMWNVKMVAYTVKNLEAYKINKEFFDCIIFEAFKPEL